jgi:hypothetical protein
LIREKKEGWKDRKSDFLVVESTIFKEYSQKSCPQAYIYISIYLYISLVTAICKGRGKIQFSVKSISSLVIMVSVTNKKEKMEE